MQAALDRVASSGERWIEPELLRLQGEVALAERSDRQGQREAEDRFDRSLRTARGFGIRSWELRSAVSLARLWQTQGKARDARTLLAPVYNGFTEGFETRDLRDAKALLEQLT